MNGQPMTLAEFLIFRITDDEELARIGCDDLIPADCWRPERILAECEAKRRIVERWRELHPDVLRLLALPYADHADYQQEWRP